MNTRTGKKDASPVGRTFLRLGVLVWRYPQVRRNDCCVLFIFRKKSDDKMKEKKETKKIMKGWIKND